MLLLRIFFDGLCEPYNPKGVPCYGFVIIDEIGNAIGSGSGLATQPFGPHSTNNYAEYKALIKALEWIIENKKDCDEIAIYGDSQLVIRHLTGEYAVRSPNIAPLYMSCIELLRNFEKKSYTWIPREQNVKADELSFKAYSDFWYRWKGEKPPERKRRR